MRACGRVSFNAGMARRVEHVSVRVGASDACSSILFATEDEFKAYAAPTDRGIQSLDTDVDDQLVYDSPESLRASAKVYQGIADSAPPWAPEIKTSNEALAAQQLAAADAMEAREKKFSAGVVTRQIALSKQWHTFRDQWDTFYADPTKDTSTTGETCQVISSSDAEYRKFLAEFQSLGLSASYVPPDLPAGNDIGTYVKWGVFVGVVVAAIYVARSLAG